MSQTRLPIVLLVVLLLSGVLFVQRLTGGGRQGSLGHWRAAQRCRRQAVSATHAIGAG